MHHSQVAKLEEILHSLREVDGVQTAMVLDHAGAILAHRPRTIHDVPRLQRIGRAMASAADAARLLQDDWELLVTEFGAGRLVLRSLRFAGVRPRSCLLAVIGDATVNLAFLGVALRVAASKLRAELETVPAASVVDAPATIAAAAPALPAQPALLARPAGPPVSSITARLPLPPPPCDLVDTGLTWSSPSPGSAAASGLTGDVGVSDPASSTFLSACTRALGASVGPMAKVFVKEAVRRICGERPFSRADGVALIAQLAAGIDDIEDRALFEHAARSL